MGPSEDAESRHRSALASQKALVSTALDSGKPDTALSTLREMLRENPDDPTIHNLMGLTQLALKNPDRAAKHFRKAYKLDPLPSIGLNLSSAYIENGDHDKAIALLKALLAVKDPKKAYPYRERLYHNLGYAYSRQKQYTKATQWFGEALDENPTFFPAYLELARVYEKTNRPALAAKAYRQSTDYCQVCYEPVQSLAGLYVKLGKYGDARMALLKFTKTEGVTAGDRQAAERLLKTVTMAGLPGKRL